MQNFLEIIRDNRAGKLRGIYSICTAQPMALEAALLQGKQDGTPILIEATANQVNQFGGYTGMTPADFIPFIEDIAGRVGFPAGDLILGGDHLGPLVWSDEPVSEAMDKARDLIAAYVSAGFKKIHLDTSMACAGDDNVLSDEIVATRAAELCEVAEQTARGAFGQSDLVYVVGTEVPPPGGAANNIEGLQVTGTGQVKQTVAAHKDAFSARGLNGAWDRVIGLVVQPGVEFDHTSVHDYQPDRTAALTEVIRDIPNLVYEAHSTDYQPASAYQALVRDHFAILKVGPQLTYALREALFALSNIEEELIHSEYCAGLKSVCEQVMLSEPKHWVKYYAAHQERLLRRYSYSDRIRYYWNHPLVADAVDKLLANLTDTTIPLPLLSQYLPRQYAAVRAGDLANHPRELVIHNVMQITGRYAAACWKQQTSV